MRRVEGARTKVGDLVHASTMADLSETSTQAPALLDRVGGDEELLGGLGSGSTLGEYPHRWVGFVEAFIRGDE